MSWSEKQGTQHGQNRLRRQQNLSIPHTENSLPMRRYHRSPSISSFNLDSRCQRPSMQMRLGGVGQAFGTRYANFLLRSGVRHRFKHETANFPPIAHIPRSRSGRACITTTDVKSRGRIFGGSSMGVDCVSDLEDEVEDQGKQTLLHRCV